jgi:para-aminobenzoate synthetase component 1
VSRSPATPIDGPAAPEPDGHDASASASPFAPPLAPDLAPRVAPYIDELVPAPDPLDIVARLRDLPYLLFLDGATDPQRLGRYSFVTADPPRVVVAKNGQTTLHSPESGTSTPVSGDPLLTVRTLLAPFATDPVPGVPPFQGGAAGYIGYDYGATLERLPVPRYDDLNIPDVVLGLYDWVIAWDHQQHRAWLISTGFPTSDPAGRAAHARARAARIARRLADADAAASNTATRWYAAEWYATASDFQDPTPRAAGAPTYAVPDHPHLRSSYPYDGYLAAVARVRDYIVAGDIFQANLSQRLEAPYDGDPWSLYRRLRAINPAPFAAYFEAPGLAVVSASPERFIQVGVDGAVETRPIKGTSPRGIGPEHDAHLGRALTESEKDRAENLMIVDLLRNDLSRACLPGSVRVPELFALEHFSTVHHLVSTVVGRLAPGVDAVGLLRAAFPGGSITGAPKVRAMEIIAELEPSRRGVYCGTVAYVSLTGAADSNIVIRTYLARHGRVYFSVGGGIVADSDPDAEYRETLDKARALIAALS